MLSVTLSPNKGVVIGVLLLVLWGVTLVFLLTRDLSAMPALAVIPAVLVQTFLYTGIFITAHDAMHGLVAPTRKRLNRFLGALCVLLFALFSFRRLQAEHRKHHAHPASAADPDYHDGRHTGFWRWYLHFMLTYVTWWQLAGMAVVFNILLHLAQVPVANLLLFWIAPSLLSTLQLFYFGTYLPHREPAGGYSDQHHARSNDFPVLWSFLSCYHFGYHWEHHAYPYVPWWQLPAMRRKLARAASAQS